MNGETVSKPDRNGQDGGVGAGRRVVCGLIPLPITGGQCATSADGWLSEAKGGGTSDQYDTFSC